MIPRVAAALSVVISLCLSADSVQAKKGDSSQYQVRVVEPPALPDSSARPDSAVRPVLTGVDYESGIFTLKIMVKFDHVPKRYLVYPIENNIKLVLDCYETDSAAGFTFPPMPARIESARVKKIDAGEDFSLTRLIFHLAKPASFNVEEASQTLCLTMVPEKDTVKSTVVSKITPRRILFVSLGAAVLAGGAIAILNSGSSHGPDNGGTPEPGVIPYINVPTPDGN